MDIDNIEELKEKFADFKQMFSEDRIDEATALIKELLEGIEGQFDVRKAGIIDNRGHIHISEKNVQSIQKAKSTSLEKNDNIYISLNHVMEYYVYAYYYKPDVQVCCTQLPIGEYYRTYGDLSVKLGRYKAGAAAYKDAICWNPVDLDAILGLAECYKYLNMLERYLIATKEAYKLCCTRATMARYYRNMGYYHVSKYNTQTARCCYLYSNIYYKTQNADSELDYLKNALGDDAPQWSIKEMQKILEQSDIELGPNPDTIGVIYRVGELMMNDSEYSLARDCFSICYDITQEELLERMLKQLDEFLGNGV